jgi:hypothetical protein
VLARTPVRLTAGGTTTIQVALPGSRTFEEVFIELSEPPDGITVQKVSPGVEVLSVVLACDAAKAKSGLQGNLILTAFGERGGDKKKGQSRQRIPLAIFPAIPFEVAGGKNP